MEGTKHYEGQREESVRAYAWNVSHSLDQRGYSGESRKAEVKDDWYGSPDNNTDWGSLAAQNWRLTIRWNIAQKDY